MQIITAIVILSLKTQQYDTNIGAAPMYYSRLRGRVVTGVGHLGHDEAMEAGGREFDPRPGHYSRMNF